MSRGSPAATAASCQAATRAKNERRGAATPQDGRRTSAADSTGRLSPTMVRANGPSEGQAGPERAGSQPVALADELRAADAGEDGVELRGGLAVRLAPALDDALPVAAHDRVQRGVAVGAHERLEPLPLLVRGLEDAVGGPQGARERLDQVGLAHPDRLLEHVAELGRAGRDPEMLLNRRSLDEPAEALRLELGAELPVVQPRIELTAPQLLGEQRRGGIDRRGVLCQVDPRRFPAVGEEQQPGLVERPAGDPNALALEIREHPDRAVALHHQRADVGRVGDPGDRHAVGPLARDPEPVLDDRVGRVAHERHVSRVVTAERLYGEGETLLLVQLMVLQDVQLPGHRAELEDADLERAEVCRAGGCRQRGPGSNTQRQGFAAPHPKPPSDPCGNSGSVALVPRGFKRGSPAQGGNDPTRDRPGRAAGHRPAVDQGDRGDEAQAAGGEGLLRRGEVGGRKRHLSRVRAKARGDLKEEPTRDAGESALVVGWREKSAVPDRPEVRGGGAGEAVPRVQQQRFVTMAGVFLPKGGGRVEGGGGLGPGGGGGAGGWGGPGGGGGGPAGGG